MSRFIVYQTKNGISNIVYDAIIPTNMVETCVTLYYTMYQTSDTATDYYFNVVGTSETEAHVITYKLAFTE